MTPEETIFEKAQWWKAGMLSGSDASLKAVIGYEMKVAIEAAILAEREACAKICDVAKDEIEGVIASEMVDLVSPITDPLKYCAKQIRARSNALESPKEAVGDNFRGERIGRFEYMKKNGQ